MISWLGLAVPQFRENPIEAEVEFAEKGQIWIGYMPNLIPVDKEAYRMKRACLHNILMLFLPVALWGQFSIADLPKLKDYESERASSFDRSGGNHDYVAVDPGQTVTIFDHDGPGEIRHIWTTLPKWSEVYAHQKVVIRAYWDGETDPSIEAPIGNFFGFAFGTPPVFQSALITINPVQALNSYFRCRFVRMLVSQSRTREVSKLPITTGTSIG